MSTMGAMNYQTEYFDKANHDVDLIEKFPKLGLRKRLLRNTKRSFEEIQGNSLSYS